MISPRATAVTTAVCVAALLIGVHSSAHASYIDPGSTAYLFQMAVAGVFGVLYTVRQVVRRISERKTQQQAEPSDKS